jgi:predicted MFS family arabinose efflux permease
MGFGTGGALGAYAGGYFYDITASYMIPFIMLLVIILLGIGGIWLAAPRRRALF